MNDCHSITMSQLSKPPFSRRQLPIAAAFRGLCYDYTALLSIQLTATTHYVGSVVLPYCCS